MFRVPNVARPGNRQFWVSSTASFLTLSGQMLRCWGTAN